MPRSIHCTPETAVSEEVVTASAGNFHREAQSDFYLANEDAGIRNCAILGSILRGQVEIKCTRAKALHIRTLQ